MYNKPSIFVLFGIHNLLISGHSNTNW